LDPGQPQFTTEGLISYFTVESPILSPSYKLISEQKPFSSRYFGSNNSLDSAEAYVNHGLDMINCHYQNHGGIPCKLDKKLL
jgi:polynucleotide 5'-kinase involved in rRNA processing